jgi:hypothetical protein
MPSTDPDDQARNRLNEKCSLVGSVAFDVVKALLEPSAKSGLKSVCGKLTTTAYANWALRADGPAFWGCPTPVKFTDPMAPGYPVSFRVSRRVLFSHFARRNPKNCSARCSSSILRIQCSGHSISGLERSAGLWACWGCAQLVYVPCLYRQPLAHHPNQVERVFEAYKTNASPTSEHLPTFKKETNKASVSGYISDAEKLTPKYRNLLLAQLITPGLIPAAKPSVDATVARPVTVEQKRGQLFVPSSDDEPSGSDSEGEDSSTPGNGDGRTLEGGHDGSSESASGGVSEDALSVSEDENSTSEDGDGSASESERSDAASASRGAT